MNNCQLCEINAEIQLILKSLHRAEGPDQNLYHNVFLHFGRYIIKPCHSYKHLRTIKNVFKSHIVIIETFYVWYCPSLGSAPVLDEHLIAFKSN